MPSSPDNERRDILRSYFRKLGFDVAMRGEFRFDGTSKIEAAVLAALNGGGAVAAQFAEDMKILGGEGAQKVRGRAEDLLSSAAADKTKDLIGWGVSKLAGLFDGRTEQAAQETQAAREAREIAERFKAAADRIGRRERGVR